jgi:CelD/BcsL family acetyltransferase involved in cellulose biosynthesis
MAAFASIMSGLRAVSSKVHAVNWSLVFPMWDAPRRYRMVSLPNNDSSPPRSPRPNESVSIRVIRSEHELAALAAQWHALFDAAECRLPFLHFSWIEEWWRAFGSGAPFVHNELSILVAEDAGRPVGIVPYYRTTYGIANLFCVRYVRPLGSDANLTEVRTALVLPEYAGRVFAAVERFFAHDTNGWDLINWGSHQVPIAPGSSVPGYSFSADLHEPMEMFVLELPETWAAFAASWKRNTKESVRKAHNALKRDGRTVGFRCLHHADDILPLLPRFYELHRCRAEQKGTVPHPDLFTHRTHRRFLTGLTRAMADAGILKLFVLEVDGAMVAMRLGFVVRDTLYCYYSGFDPAFSRYSVMARLKVDMMRWAMDQGLRRINLSTGRDQSKLRWNPKVVQFRTYSQIGTRFRSRLTFALFARS